MSLTNFKNADLTINNINTTYIPKQYASEGDYLGRTLTVQITDDGLIGRIDGAQLVLHWKNIASGLSDDSAFTLIDAENTIFRIEYPQNMLTPGTVKANILVIYQGKTTVSREFEITVADVAGQSTGVLAKAEFSALVAALSNANGVLGRVERLENVKVDKAGVGQVSWANLSQEARANIAGGNVAVVGANSVLTDNIVDKAVTTAKLADNVQKKIESAVSPSGETIKNKDNVDTTNIVYINTKDVNASVSLAQAENRMFAFKTSGDGIGARVDIATNEYLKTYTSKVSAYLYCLTNVTVTPYFNLLDKNKSKVATFTGIPFYIGAGRRYKYDYVLDRLNYAFSDVAAENFGFLEIEFVCNKDISLGLTGLSVTASAIQTPELNISPDKMTKISTQNAYETSFLSTGTGTRAGISVIDGEYYATRKVGAGIGQRLAKSTIPSIFYRSFDFAGKVICNTDANIDFYINLYDINNTKLESIYHSQIRVAKDTAHTFDKIIQPLNTYNLKTDASKIYFIEFELVASESYQLHATDFSLKMREKSPVNSPKNSDINILETDAPIDMTTNTFKNGIGEDIPIERVVIDNKVWAKCTSGLSIRQYIRLDLYPFVKWRGMQFSGKVLASKDTMIAIRAYVKIGDTVTNIINFPQFFVNANVIFDFNYGIQALNKYVADLTNLTEFYIDIQRESVDVEISTTDWKVTVDNRQNEYQKKYNVDDNLFINANFANEANNTYIQTLVPDIAPEITLIDNKCFAKITKGTNIGQRVTLAANPHLKLYKSEWSGEFLLSGEDQTCTFYVNAFDASNKNLGVYTAGVKRDNVINRVYTFTHSIPDVLSMFPNVDATTISYLIFEIVNAGGGACVTNWNLKIKYPSVTNDKATSNVATGRVARLDITGAMPTTKDETKYYNAKLYRDGFAEDLYCSLKWQGSSSLDAEKKNYRIALFKDSTYADKNEMQVYPYLSKNDKYNLKGFFSDPTFSCDFVAGRVWRAMVSSRKKVDSHILKAQNFASPNGFPVQIYLNDEFYGLYMWLPRKDKKYYGLTGDDINGFIVEGQSTTDECLFWKSSDTLDGTNFEVQESNDTDENTLANWNALMKFINESTDAEFAANVENRLDVESIIDYALIVMGLAATDNTARNTQYVTYDGYKFFATIYDFNQILGNSWDGTQIFEDRLTQNYLPFKDPNWQNKENRFYSRVMSLYKEQAKNRYWELRKTCLNTQFIVEAMNYNLDQIGEALRQKDMKKWNLASADVVTPQRLLENMTLRFQALDEQITNW